MPKPPIRRIAASVLMLASPVILAQSENQTETQSEARSEAREQIARRCEAAEALATTGLARGFLAAGRELGPMPAPRSVYFSETDRRYIDRAGYDALPEGERAAFERREIGEATYYGRSSPPVLWVRALDLVAEAGFDSADGKKIVDFGFGNVAQLRMLASLGADTVGIEIEGFHDVAFGYPADTGPVGRAEAAGPGRDGSIDLAFGRWPSTPEIIDHVGGGIDLFMTKNTLKKGYIHPEREAPDRWLIDLGVDDETFVRELYGALAPGGYVLIYNLYPKPAGPDERYIPWASGECPFGASLLRRAGFELVSFNEDDSDAAHDMWLTLGIGGEQTREELREGLFAMVTILRKPLD
ncbi:MAG: hypothetical protein AAFQ71_13355 [Planctomycetota bacterium]